MEGQAEAEDRAADQAQRAAHCADLYAVNASSCHRGIAGGGRAGEQLAVQVRSIPCSGFQWYGVNERSLCRGCPYIESDGSLLARLEARLVQPGSSDCIIC